MKRTNIKLIILSLIVWTCAQTMQAVPANPRPFTVVQKDGSTLELRLMGDENYHYYQTLDGVALVRAGKDFYYAEAGMDGGLFSTGVLAHEAAVRGEGERRLVEMNRQAVAGRIRTEWGERLSLRNTQRQEAVSARKVRQRAFGHPTSYKGKKRGIVILVNYADLNMKASSSRQAWDDQFNKPGYNKNSHIGSVRDYFLDQSYQQLTIDFDVVGPYTVSEGWRYYGKQRDGSDQHPCQLVSEACKLADEDVNFKDYDWNGDGEVDQVFVVYAGYSAAAGYDDDAIWPHEWHLAYGAYYGDGQGALRLDDVKIDTYALSSELQGTKGTTMDPIGTAVHEFSHCLGLPDFYDVDGNGTQCMDYWDVLDAGCYSGPQWKGEVPTGYTAYERNFAGWLKYEELTTPRKITGMPDLGDEPTAYIYYNQGNKNEYFILENRQAKRWFEYPVRGHGLFFYHVDYDRAAWENDRPNSVAGHPRMTYVSADKSFERANTGQMVSDFFPGTANVRTLNNTSHASCYGKMFNKNSDGTMNTNLILTSITESGGKVTFTYNGGEAGVKKELNTLIANVKAMLDVPHTDVTEGASDRLESGIRDAEADYSECSTTQEFTDAMATLKKEVAQFLGNAVPDSLERPFDITFLLTNAEVASNAGWKEETANNAFTFTDNLGTYTNMKFNLTQTLPVKMPHGLYRVTCQGFQRPGKADACTTNAVNVNLYARTSSVKLKHIQDEAQEARKTTTDVMLEEKGYVPGGTKGASTYFRAGMYLNELEFELPTDNTTLKVGLRCTQSKADYWTCFTNFRLYYLADGKEDAINAVTPDKKEAEATYDLTGRRVSEAQGSKGIYIKNGRKVVK